MVNQLFKVCQWEWTRDRDRDRGAVTVKAECALLLYAEGRASVWFGRKRRMLTGKMMLYVQPETTVAIQPTDDNSELVVTGIYFHCYALRQRSDDTLLYRLDYSRLPNNGYVLKPISQRTRDSCASLSGLGGRRLMTIMRANAI